MIVAAALGLTAAWERWGGRRTAALAAAGLASAIAFTLLVART